MRLYEVHVLYFVFTLRAERKCGSVQGEGENLRTSLTNYKLVHFAILYLEAPASKSISFCNINRNTVRGKQPFNHHGQTKKIKNRRSNF